jgi:uncharacterized protein YciI
VIGPRDTGSRACPRVATLAFRTLPDQGFTRAAASGKLASMFVIELTYKAPLKDIDASMPAHVKFLKKYYATGHFVVSGRKIPRDGGIIVAVGDDREQIEAIAREDPFYARGLADVRVIEFRVSQHSDAIQKLIDR